MSTVMPSSVLSRCREGLICTICKDTFHSPISLPCTHTFCLSCLEFFFKEKKDGEEITCPTCLGVALVPNGGLEHFPIEPYVNGLLCEVKRLQEESDRSHPWNTCSMCSTTLTVSGETEIIQSDLLNQLFDISPMQSQTSPEQCESSAPQPATANQQGKNLPGSDKSIMNDTVAQHGGMPVQQGGQAGSSGHYCYECDLLMCEKCAFIHLRIPETDKHDVKTFKSKKKLDSIKPPVCQRHSPAQIRYYCYDCAEVGCRQCMSKNHLNHAYANLKEASQRDRANIEKLFSSWIEPKAAACKAFKKEMNDVQANIKALEAVVKPEVTEHPVKTSLRNLWPGNDDEIDEEGQQRAKKRCLEEQLNGLDEDIEMMEDKQKVIMSYKAKVESMQTELTYASLLQSTQIISCVGEKEFNDVVPSIGGENVDQNEQQQQQNGLLAEEAGIIDHLNPADQAPAENVDQNEQQQEAPAENVDQNEQQQEENGQLAEEPLIIDQLIPADQAPAAEARWEIGGENVDQNEQQQQNGLLAEEAGIIDHLNPADQAPAENVDQNEQQEEENEQLAEEPLIIDQLIPADQALAAEPRLERCLALIKKSRKSSSLWKMQLFSVDNFDHSKKMIFAPCEASQGVTLAYIFSDTIYAVAGGRHANKLWQYTHFAGRWSFRTDIPQIRRGVGVIQANEHLFLFGGCAGLFGMATMTIQSFNLISNSWSYDVSYLAQGVCNPMCIEYNGLIYIFGGSTEYQQTRTRVVQTYDPVTRVSTTLDSLMPCDLPFHVIRWNIYAVFIGQVTGCVYNFEDRTWHTRERFKVGMAYFSVDVIDDMLYLIGARCNEVECWKYVDMKSLHAADFVFDNPEANWRVVATYMSNKQRRQRPAYTYTATAAGSMKVGFV